MIVAIDEVDTHTSISNYRLVDNATHSQRVTPIAFRRSRHWCHCDHQKGKLATLSLMKEPDSIKSWRTQTDGEKEDKAGHTDHVHIHLCVCIAAVALATVVTVHQERERVVDVKAVDGQRAKSYANDRTDVISLLQRKEDGWEVRKAERVSSASFYSTPCWWSRPLAHWLRQSKLVPI